LLRTTPAIAQEEPPPQPSAVVTILKSTVYDPSSYAPAVVKYTAMHLDWESSQIFFRHGFVERNPRYTVNGLTNDLPVAHGEGLQRLTVDSVRVLAHSVPQNLAERTIEHVLIRMFPSRRKAFVIAGQVGRAVAATYMSYAVSAVHFRQWQRNESLARHLGYK